MYTWNIGYIEKLLKIAWPAYFIFFVVVIYLSMKNANYLSTMILFYFGIRAALDKKRKIQEIKDDPSSAPYVDLYEEYLSYREKPNGYCISIPYSSIENINHLNILGLTKLSIKTDKNQEITIWNIANSRVLFHKLKNLTSKGNG